MAYQHYFLGLVSECFKIELHPYNKHKEDKPDLTQELQVSEALNRKKRGGKYRQKRTGKGWTKQYAGYNFAYYRRLTDFK